MKEQLTKAIETAFTSIRVEDAALSISILPHTVPSIIQMQVLQNRVDDETLAITTFIKALNKFYKGHGLIQQDRIFSYHITTYHEDECLVITFTISDLNNIN